MRLRSSKSHSVGKAYLVSSTPLPDGSGCRKWHRPSAHLLSVYTAIKKDAQNGESEEWMLFVMQSGFTHNGRHGNFVMRHTDLNYIADAFGLPLHKP